MVRRSRVAYVRLSPPDHQEITRRARTVGLSVSDFLRRAGLDATINAPVPELNVKAWRELARSAANINQLAHHLNEERIHGRGKLDADHLRQELRRMYGHIAALRRALIAEAPP